MKRYQSEEINLQALVFHMKSCTSRYLNSGQIKTETGISLEAALILSVIQALIQQMFIKYLLCAGHYSRLRGTASGEGKKKSLP